jgi:cytochrome c
MSPFIRIRWHAAWMSVMAAVIALMTLGTVRHAHAGQAAVTVLDGVYTAEQARRGEKLYADTCSICHGDGAVGTSVAPSLVGADFLADFGGMSVGDLFSKVIKTMPSDDPGTLMSPQTADLLAYIFLQNKWPAGQKELSADANALKQIRILTK